MAREHSYNSGRIQRAGGGRQEPPRRAPEPQRRPSQRPPQRPVKQRKKRRPLAVVLITLLVIVGIGAAGFGALYLYVDGVLDTGLPGFIRADNYTPKEFQKDVINILIVGIDNEEARDYGSGLGQTDMILYANFLPKEGKLNLLQIPRDSYVGNITGSNGKINSLLITGPDKKNPINNLVDCIVDQYKLPVDRYISMDMDAMKAIVNTFGGIKVFVPRDMAYGGSYLEQGWRWLDGDAAEFFVRNRHGEGFERADIDRLDNQRHFYSALFRRFLNLTVPDMFNLLPVFEHYCNTDIGMKDIYDLAFSAMKLDASGVTFCKVPGATATGGWNPVGGETSYYYVDVDGRSTETDPGLANLLNQYFRTYGDPVPAEAFNVPDIPIPEGVSLYSPNVQVMGDVQAEEGGEDVDVEPTA